MATAERLVQIEVDPKERRNGDEEFVLPLLEFRDLQVRYGKFLALDVPELVIPAGKITAIIGPSGCGKSTLLRCLNRMNDLIPGCKTKGGVLLYANEELSHDIYDPDVCAYEVRKRIGMVFQKPNVFPRSVAYNVWHGAHLLSRKERREQGLTNKQKEIERALRQAALWDEVSDRLGVSGLELSGGQQQRLCLARALMTNPPVLLMDEPCGSLDPQNTLLIEETMKVLRNGGQTIVIVTHNMQQAARVSDMCVMMWMDEFRTGGVIEVGQTDEIFTNPRDSRTEDYVTGRYG